MIRQEKIQSFLLISILFVSIILFPVGKSCKDIIVSPPATAGDYALLLKVRDPSRPGLQVLCRVPNGTHYTYRHPWTGKPWDFIVTHAFLGVATLGDTLPDIVKAGMVLTDAGLAFGDADTGSLWVNPTKNAWDDFDWIRYACQSADSEEEAISLLTTEATDQLHATGVSENLLVVGPQRSVVIEADAVHHTTKDVSDVLVMSNYPKDLWRTQLIKSLPIASSYDAQKETWVQQGIIVHLGSLCGIRIQAITQSSLTAQVFPLFAFTNSDVSKEITISLGERGTVGPYSVTLVEIDGNKAKISMTTSMYAWEQALLDYLQPMSGTITIQNLINVSRLHSEDLNGLRPLCEDAVQYEAAIVFKVPTEHANLLSSGWFAANHPCSSIYVPVHICDDDFYDSYETGDAATVSLSLLKKYGHGNLTSLCESVEAVFLFENELNELLAHQMIHLELNITSFLTALDRGMQEQAFLTEELWLNAPNASRAIIENLWTENYTMSQHRMQQTMSLLRNISWSESVVSHIEKIVTSIKKSDDQRKGFVFLYYLFSSHNTIIEDSP
jgi:hypothetical protein